MRNQYTYSPTERYEHIYLNDNFYAWQCLDGVEKGLADVDRCHYVQVAEDLYLFVWREKIIPTLGVILIDLQQMRTDGKIMGYQGSDFGALSNFPVGATRRSSTSPAIRNSRRRRARFQAPHPSFRRVTAAPYPAYRGLSQAHTSQAR